MHIIEATNIHKAFADQQVLNHLDFYVEEHEMVAIMGSSGSGKSTLLNIIGLLDTPDQGELRLFGEADIKPFSRKATRMLRDKIGFLFQNFALIEDKSVNDNLLLALKMRKIKDKQQMVVAALKKVGLDDAIDKKIYQCSGGEQQRIAVARLLLKPCSLILADEPTGSLDLRNRDEIIHLLKLLQGEGKTVVIVTHDPIVAQACDRIVRLD